MSFLDDVDALRSKSGFSPARKAVVVGLALVLVVVVVLGAQLVWGMFTAPGAVEDGSSLVVTHDDATGDGAARQNSDDGAPTGEEAGSTQGAAATTVYVHVAGAVAQPGLYALEEGSRVQDAIEAAGGLTKDALDQSINLARVVTDGEQIIVTSKADAAVSDGLSGNATRGTSGSSSSSSGSSASGVVSGKVNINQASAEELTTLQGVGQATAAKIIAYREEHGSFKRIEDIKQVSGIGDKKFENIKDSITV